MIRAVSFFSKENAHLVEPFPWLRILGTTKYMWQESRCKIVRRRIGSGYIVNRKRERDRDMHYKVQHKR